MESSQQPGKPKERADQPWDLARARQSNELSDVPDGRYEELRRLLVDPEQRQIEELQRRLDDSDVRALELAGVLPKAITVRPPEDTGLLDAMLPVVQDSLQLTVRRAPHVVVEAIFPIIGPAIRKAVASSLRAMVETLNRILENSLSWKGLQWRWEALKTGRTFAEVALAHNFVYRVRGIFLIHRETGLLLQYTGADSSTKDHHVVSSMLTAIQDFVRDSFSLEETDHLDTLEVGELSVWIERGPHAVLAAVISGTAPESLRTDLQDALAKIHQECSTELFGFRGDASALEVCRPQLEACLKAERREERAPGWRKLLILAGLAVLLLTAWLGLRLHANWKLHGLVETLAREPGVVVLQSGRKDGRLWVAGLRDPDAVDPAALLARAALEPKEVILALEPYLSLSPILIKARAERLLASPSTVSLRVKGDVLYASGVAPRDWIGAARQRAPAIVGVSRLDTEELRESEAERFSSLRADVESTIILFPSLTSEPPEEQTESLNGLAGVLGELLAVAETVQRRVKLEIAGYTDRTGNEVANLHLSRLRADRVRSLLLEKGLPADRLVARGMGPTGPPADQASEQERAPSRRVSFRVVEETPDP